MSEILHIDTEKARLDPASQFGSPDDLARSQGLTLGQKLAALDRWERQVQDRLAAGNEGMPTHWTTPHEMELLEQIQAARVSLN
ncbi:MAG: hypothetical protein AB7O43_11445 [Hyphomicrobiaceae bacterium]